MRIPIRAGVGVRMFDRSMMSPISRRHRRVGFARNYSSHADFLQRAMDVIGLSAAEQNAIFKVLATILWLGNVNFVEGDDGNSAIEDTGVTDFAAYLMEVEPKQLQKVLLSRVMETQRGGRRGEGLLGTRRCARWRLMIRFGVRGAFECGSGVVRSRCLGESALQQPLRMDRQPSECLNEAKGGNGLCHRCTGYLASPPR